MQLCQKLKKRMALTVRNLQNGLNGASLSSVALQKSTKKYKLSDTDKLFTNASHGKPQCKLYVPSQNMSYLSRTMARMEVIGLIKTNWSTPCFTRRQKTLQERQRLAMFYKEQLCSDLLISLQWPQFIKRPWLLDPSFELQVYNQGIFSAQKLNQKLHEDIQHVCFVDISHCVADQGPFRMEDRDKSGSLINLIKWKSTLESCYTIQSENDLPESS